MKRINRYSLAFFVLVFILGLIICFRTFLVSNIIKPIAVLLWAVWRIVASVNQNTYWMILIVVCSILVIRLIPSGKDHTPGTAYNYKHRSPNRVEYWQTLVKDAILGEEEIERLRDNLKRLWMSGLVQEKRSDPAELEKLIETGAVPLSRETRDFLFPPKGINGIFSLRQRLDIESFIPKWFRRWAGKFTRQDTASMDEILERMEIEMEITHDT